MRQNRRITGLLLAGSLAAASVTVNVPFSAAAAAETSAGGVKDSIEETLNLANNETVTWTWSADAQAWTMSVVTAVVNPELPDQQGVSVCVPGAYVKGIDTDGDGTEDVTAEAAADAVQGSLVIDYDASVTSENGQTYTASTAPVIINTGAAGYGSQSNSAASAAYAGDGYINVACGNRGKQDTVTDDDGNTVYTGDAPSCLVDQKNAVRFVKYNILLGNLPGSVDYFVSTGGSGGGAHATMLAATSNHPDFYPYEAAAGAVGVYELEDGSYDTTVTIDGEQIELSDGVWGCVAYSPITSLAEADMAMAFEYYLDTDYSFNTAFQAQMAQYLSEEYMEYINAQELSVEEEAVSFDLNEDGDQEDTIDLRIEYDPEAYPETNGYYGTYLDLYLAEFISNLQWYLDNLDYAADWTWFDADGNALTDEEAAALTLQEKAQAFLEGRYAKSISGGMGGFAGGPGGAGGFGGDMRGNGRMGGGPGGDMDADGGMRDPVGNMGERGGMEGPDGMSAEEGMSEEDSAPATIGEEGFVPEEMSEGDFLPEGKGEAGFVPDGEMPAGEMPVGTPDAGTTQSAGVSMDSASYGTFAEMVEAYEADIEEISAGDQYGNNLVDLYNPLNYIGAEETENPVWVRLMMGAAEGDMSMFSSLNLQIAMLGAGIDASIEWQWDGGHVPSEVLGESLALCVDTMYGKYVEGASEITKAPAQAQTANGTAESPSGTDLTGWVQTDENGQVSFSLADAASYRTDGASKATPGFDVMDYGQEDYVFGSAEKDARHWDTWLLKIFQEHEEELAALFNT